MNDRTKNLTTQALEGVSIPPLGELCTEGCELPAAAVAKVWGSLLGLLQTWRKINLTLEQHPRDMPDCDRLVDDPFCFEPQEAAGNSPLMKLLTTDQRQELPLDTIEHYCTHNQAIWLCRMAHNFVLWSQQQRKSSPSIQIELVDALFLHEQGIIHELNGYHDDAHLIVI